MPNPGDGQLSFDFAELDRQDALAHIDEWTGAPLHFTTDYYPPGELDAAFEHWCFLYGRLGSLDRSHMWHRLPWNPTIAYGPHRIEMFSASLSPGRGAEGPGGMPSQAICEPCHWQTISTDENVVVEAWHDHAAPGWRNLPVIPARIRVHDEKGLTRLARAWIAEHYPPEAQVEGAPIITERDPHATRHVPNYSPWGGYDLSDSALHRTEPEPDRSRTPRRTPPGFTSAARPVTREHDRTIGR